MPQERSLRLQGMAADTIDGMAWGFCGASLIVVKQSSAELCYGRHARLGVQFCRITSSNQLLKGERSMIMAAGFGSVEPLS